MKKRLVSLSSASIVCAVLAAACSAGEASPSQGTYTVQFPSTAAAIATDYVQLFVYDVTPDTLPYACADLIAARERQDNSVKPIVTGPQVNVCELLNGAKPITVPYGQKAVLGVGLRGADDFLVGCVVQTFGDGNAPLAIPLQLVDVGTAVPDTTCQSVGQRCTPNSGCVAH